MKTSEDKSALLESFTLAAVVTCVVSAVWFFATNVMI